MLIRRTSYYELRIDRESAIVYFTRNELPFAPRTLVDVELIERNEIEPALSGVNRASFVVLFDMRRGPVNNVPEQRAALVRLARSLNHGWAASGMLLATALGHAQVKSLMDDIGKVHLFFNENVALEWAKNESRKRT